MSSTVPTTPVSESDGRVHALPYRCWVEVSRVQIAANFQAIRNAVGPEVEIMPVVKADAYRHGAVEVSRTLQEQGARWLAVSNTDEGVTLRDAGVSTRILVMADFLPFTREAMLAYELTPVIHSLQDVVELNRLACARERRVPFHLKIDSGMSRLGVLDEPSAVVDTILSAQHLELEGLMTHFASAGDYQSTQTEQQMANFDRIIAALADAEIRPELIHMSSTIPVAYARRPAWRRMVRPGHAIYGYISPARGHAPASILDVKPALSWRASILCVKDIPAGASVGYGGMFKAPRRMRIAVLAAGYADGIPHRLSNRGSVIVNRKLCPILGAVSMDLTSIDVSACPNVRPGDAVTLLGSEGKVSIDAQQIAKLAGTISYSVLCGIHARVKRIYI